MVENKTSNGGKVFHISGAEILYQINHKSEQLN